MEASSDSEGGELDLEACDLMISDDDDECMEPVDVSDEDFDYDDFDGEEDFEAFSGRCPCFRAVFEGEKHLREL